MKCIALFELIGDECVFVKQFKSVAVLAKEYGLKERTAADWAKGNKTHQRELRKYRFCPTPDSTPEDVREYTDKLNYDLQIDKLLRIVPKDYLLSRLS